MTRLPREQFSNPGDDLVPGFDLVITSQSTDSATQLFNAVRPLVVGLTIEEDEELSSMFQLTLANQPETAPFRPANWRAVIDSKAFQEGNFIDLFLGYGNQRTFIDRVEIVKWLPNFPPEGNQTFTIKGFDGRHRLQHNNKSKPQKKKKVFYKNQTDEAIVKRIADKYGFSVNTDPTQVKKKPVTTVSGGKTTKKYVIPTRVQGAGMDDWKFLQKLAAINRFDLWVDYSRTKGQWVIHFKKRAERGDPRFVFSYNGQNGSLISAEPDFSLQEQPTDVEVLYYDRKKRSVQLTVISDTNRTEDVRLHGRSGPGSLQAKTTIKQGARVRFMAFGQTVEAFADKPFRSRKDAQNFVQNWLLERERDFLVIKGVVVGVPSLRPRQVHELAGMSARLDGLYRFTSVTHRIETGSIYKCEFVAHKILTESISRRKPTTTKAGRTTTITSKNRVKDHGAPR